MTCVSDKIGEPWNGEMCHFMEFAPSTRRSRFGVGNCTQLVITTWIEDMKQFNSLELDLIYVGELAMNYSTPWVGPLLGLVWGHLFSLSAALQALRKPP